MGNLADRPTALYRFFDSNGALLYVGITHDLEKRWDTHRRERTWWHLVARKTYEWYESRELATEAEKDAARDEGPRFDASCLEGRGFRVECERYEDPRKAEIAEQLLAAIKAGEFPPGRALPTTGILADRYATAPATIRSTLWDFQRRYLLDGEGSHFWPRGSRPRRR